MIVFLRIIQAMALFFNIWIIARVLDDWLGIVAATIGVLLTPIMVIVMPVIMFFVPSAEAGALALWPGIIVVGVAESAVSKIKLRQ